MSKETKGADLSIVHKKRNTPIFDKAVEKEIEDKEEGKAKRPAYMVAIPL